MTKPQTIQSLREEIKRLHGCWQFECDRRARQIRSLGEQGNKWFMLYHDLLDHTRKLEHMIAVRELDRK